MKTSVAVSLLFLPLVFTLNSFAEAQNSRAPEGSQNSQTPKGSQNSQTPEGSQNSPVPKGLCSNPSLPCSPRQLEILEKFEKSNTSPATPQTHSLYQGGCYMISGTYGADHEHFGYIYVHDQGHGELGFNGQFGFFYPQNPYANLTPADGAERFPDPSKNTVKVRATDWLVEIDAAQNWRYFARQLENGNLALIGLWGRNDTVICEMTENK
jgi:hypothetical protein